MLHWRLTETRILWGTTLCFAGLMVLCGLLSAKAAVLTAVALCVLFLSWLLLALHRDLRRTLEQERMQIQALGELHALLPLRLPLPPLVSWAASPQLGLEVVRAILRSRPQLVVELGSGSSTLIASYALEKVGAGKAVSIDHEAQYAEQTREGLREHGLEAWAEVRHAPLCTQSIGGRERIWYDLKALHDLKQIDVLIIDGPPVQSERDARAAAFHVLTEHLRDGAWIVVDDAERPDERRAVESFLQAHPNTQIQRIASGKGVSVLQYRA